MLAEALGNGLRFHNRFDGANGTPLATLQIARKVA